MSKVANKKKNDDVEDEVSLCTPTQQHIRPVDEEMDFDIK